MSGTIAVDDVDFVKELYPRLKPDDAAIERYRDSIDNLPPIVLARGRILVDGYHRWQAHRREGIERVRAENLGDLSDAEIFNESIRRNARHGQQLSKADKKDLTGKLYQTLAHLPQMERYAEIASLLAASESKVREWAKDAAKAERDALRDQVIDAWLNCEGSDREIGERYGVTHPTVADWGGKYCQKWQDLPPESRQHFDVWQFPNIDHDAGGSVSYFGNMAPQIVENLLWLYTDPGDIVVDLFAGSGTTVDVAKRMGRRVWAGDIRGDHWSPHLPIHKHDATVGWPDEAPSKAKLVLLDPPYWKQAAGRYSTDPSELAEMDLAAFYDAWAKVIKAAKDRAERVAYIISPTQNDDGTVVDHSTDMLRFAWEIGYTVERRIIACYSTQQATGQQVEWARENRRLLKLYRDLVVLRP